MTTISDIAKKANVSRTLVSRVLNNKPGVSPENRQKILSIMEETHYVPSGLARSLVTQKTGAIGVIMDELCNEFFLKLIAGLLTEAVLNHTNIRTIGLCNCPINMINDMSQKFSCSTDDLFLDFVGINHLIWAQKVLLRGKDVTAEAIEKICDASSKEIMANIPEVHYSPEFLRSLGMIPVSYLKYYYLQPQMLEECLADSKSKGVRGEVVKGVESELFTLYQDTDLKEKPEQLARRGGARYSDAACSLIDSIYNNKKDIQVVNVMNSGCNLDLPENAVIERNCVIDSNGAHPIQIGHTPLKIRGLLQNVKAYEQLTIQAAIYGDRDAALQALTIHPLVNSAETARLMLNDILRENQAFLPNFA